MQLIAFTETSIGSIDWELPAELADRISALPSEDMRQELLKHLELQVRGLLFQLMGALNMGTVSRRALAIIAEDQIKTSKKLIAMKGS